MMQFFEFLKSTSFQILTRNSQDAVTEIYLGNGNTCDGAFSGNN